jgi:hypothetical protein
MPPWRDHEGTIVASSAGTDLIRVEVHDGQTFGWELWGVVGHAATRLGVFPITTRVEAVAETLKPPFDLPLMPWEAWRPAPLPRTAARWPIDWVAVDPAIDGLGWAGSGTG